MAAVLVSLAPARAREINDYDVETSNRGSSVWRRRDKCRPDAHILESRARIAVLNSSTQNAPSPDLLARPQPIGPARHLAPRQMPTRGSGLGSRGVQKRSMTYAMVYQSLTPYPTPTSPAVIDRANILAKRFATKLIVWIAARNLR